MTFYLTPVTGDLLIDREKELKTLLDELSKKNSKIGFSLSGVRRIGKTSILKEVKKQLEKQGVVVIYISVWSAIPDTLETFIANLFDETMAAFKDKLPFKMKISNLIKLGRDGIADLLKHFKLSVDLENKISYTISYVKGEESDVNKATYNALQLMDKLAEKTKTKCVLIIDEFPSIAELKIGKKMIGASIIKLIRTVNEDYKKTALVVSGSFLHTMNEAVLSSSAPFYKQLVNLEINQLDDTAVQDFVKKYLKKKLTKDGLVLLLEKSSGIPYNLQMLGRQLDELKENTLDKSSIEKAIDAVLKREGEIHYKDYLGMMQSTEIKVLKVMAIHNASGPKEISDAANMKLNDVTALLKLLLDKGLIKKIERGRYQFTDNMFKTWLSRSDDKF